jgi:hypothetical protein
MLLRFFGLNLPSEDFFSLLFAFLTELFGLELVLFIELYCLDFLESEIVF